MHLLSEIATALGARLEGDGTLKIAGVSEPAAAGPDQLALAMSPKYEAGLAQGAAQAAVLWEGADWQAMGLRAALFVPRPRYAMAALTKALDPGPRIAAGIHPTAHIDAGAELGEDVAVGAHAVIEAGARIGRGARISALVHIAGGAVIGDDAMIHAGVRICGGARIGHRFIAQPGAVIGSDGFSFVTPEKSAVETVRETLGGHGETAEQSWTRIHSIGGVMISDDVEVGANSCIDQGTIRATSIGRGTKIDNLVQIGHNVTVGEDCLLCGQVGVAGSTRIGNRVVLAGQCGVNDNIFVGDDVVAGGATKIFTNVPAGRAILGYPAMKMETHVETYKALRRLPRLFRDFVALQKAVSKTGQND